MAGIFNDNFWTYLWQILLGGSNATQNYLSSQGRDNAYADLMAGKTSAEEFLGMVGQNGWHLSPEQESYVSSMLSNQRTNEARDYETMMANSDLTRAASQLGALGMSPYNVLQTGGSATPNVSAASTPMLNNANQRYNRAASVANAMIGMAGRMASSGIYGSALRAVRGSAASAASMAAHSAPAIMNQTLSDDENAWLDKFLEAER